VEIALCRQEAVSEGEMLQFELDGTIIMVCRTGGVLYAVNGVCPHRGALLASGTFAEGVVTCPWHEWAFDCTDGCGITNPQSALEQYKAWERDGQVYVELPD
jgi:nitrite reductase/ring-hydroxylating ferredoxin subunit